MLSRRLQIILDVFIFFLFNNVNPHKPSDNSDLIARLLGKKSTNPIIVVLDKSSGVRSSDLDEFITDIMSADYEEEAETKNEDKKQGNNEAYLLYRLLRERQDEEQQRKEPKTQDSTEDAKHIFHQALRARCNKLQTCVVKCPKKKPTCPFNCKQVFDNLDMCDEPTTTQNPCKKPKCGRTMPPNWLLL